MPRINYLVILLLIVIFCFPAPIFAETIILKSGKSVEGKLLEKTDEYIKIDFEGIPLTYFLDEIKSIDGKPVNVAAKIPKSSGYKKDPTNIFKDISPAVVYIVSRAAGKENIGSGFILKSSGVIATNYHVVVSAEEIDIKLKDGTSYPVDSIIYYDVNRDLCILKIEATQLPFVAIGNSDNLEIGEKVYCIGNPLGLEYSLSDGLLSGVRDFQGVKYLQFSAPISGGNSGGPLINAAGEIIGMNTFVYEEGQNLNFALAVNEIKPFISSVPKLTLKEFLNDRSHAEYYFLQGNKDNLQNNFEEAISNYTKAIQINPNYTEAYRNRGGTYIYIGKFNEGLNDLNKAVELNPNDHTVWEGRGWAYARMENWDQVISDLNKAIVLKPNCDVCYYNRAIACYKKNNFNQALLDLNRVISIRPNDAQLYRERADLYYRMQDYNRAWDDVHKVEFLTGSTAAPNDEFIAELRKASGRGR